MIGATVQGLNRAGGHGTRRKHEKASKRQGVERKKSTPGVAARAALSRNTADTHAPFSLNLPIADIKGRTAHHAAGKGRPREGGERKQGI
jgi:hypothetical protein